MLVRIELKILLNPDDDTRKKNLHAHTVVAVICHLLLDAFHIRLGFQVVVRPTLESLEFCYISTLTSNEIARFQGWGYPRLSLNSYYALSAADCLHQSHSRAVFASIIIGLRVVFTF